MLHEKAMCSVQQPQIKSQLKATSNYYVSVVLDHSAVAMDTHPVFVLSQGTLWTSWGG